ncbi:MAG: hypothetical protein GXY13_09635 [Acidimicrobiales bacterium]|nr:hypothetical protein [Acidimicrobiales bacterium]
MPGIEALRLTAALVHTVPSVTALLTPDHGRDVVVGSDPRCHPDLSACQLRRLVADERRGSNPFTWLSAVRSIELGGPDVTVIDDDVVRLGDRDQPVLVFSTLLGPFEVRSVLGDVGRDRRDSGAHSPELLASLKASTFHDELLDASTVVVGESPLAADGEVAEIVRTAARATRVAELLAVVARA